VTEAACGPVRAALSADLDGEDAGVDGEVVDHHLAACASCRRFADALPTVARRTRLAAAAPVPDLTARITRALDTTRADTSRVTERRRRRVRDLRILVALAGAAQLIVAVPLLLGLIGPDLHVGRDLGALQVALGVGLLVTAVQPRRAAGLLPVVAVVAAVTVVTASIDVATGTATLVAELTHLSEVVGVLALWGLVRHQQRGHATDSEPPDPPRSGTSADLRMERA